MKRLNRSLAALFFLAGCESIEEMGGLVTDKEPDPTADKQMYPLVEKGPYLGELKRSEPAEALRPDYVEEGHIQVEDGSWVYKFYKHGNFKEPDPDRGVGTGVFGFLDRRTVEITEPEFNKDVRVGFGCSGGIVEFDEKYALPPGVYVSSAAHCVRNRLPGQLSVQGNYLNTYGVERRFELQNPVVWQSPEFVDDRIGDSVYSYTVSDDLAILYFPDAVLPKEVKPIAQKVFNENARVLTGMTVDTAGYSYDMTGLSVDERCFVRSVGDFIHGLSQSTIEEIQSKHPVVIPKGSNQTIVDVIQTDCALTGGASGSLLTGEIDGTQQALGNVVTSQGNKDGNFGYLTEKDMAHAGAFFRAVAYWRNEKAAVMENDRQLCAFVNVNSSLAFRNGPGTNFEENGARLTSSDEVVSGLDGMNRSAEGYTWQRVQVRGEERTGYVASRYLGEFKVCTP